MPKIYFYHRSFLYGVSAFCLGVWSSARGWTSVSSFFFSLIFLVLLFVSRSWRFFVWLPVFVGLGFLRYDLALPNPTLADLAFYNDRSEVLILEGLIADEIDLRSDRLRLTLAVDRLAFSSFPEVIFPSHGKALITLPRYPDSYEYGQRLHVEGFLQTPAEFEDFSYRNYLRRYGIGSVLYEPLNIEMLDVASRRSLFRWLYAFKSLLEYRLNRLFPEPHASFAAGLLLGSRRSIPSKILDEFNRTGLTHILAISGYNITLLITFVSGLFRFLSQRKQILLATVVVVVFVFLVGASAAVVRAAVMGLLALWAIWFRRPSDAIHLLFLSAGLMVFIQPFLLVDDVGFQLSFAATSGLIFVSDPLRRALEKIGLYQKLPSLFAIRETLLATLAAQVFATPLILVYFGRLSLIAPVANVTIAFVIPLAMLFTFFALLLSFFWWYGGLAMAYVAWFFLSWILEIASFLAEAPFSSILYTQIGP